MKLTEIESSNIAAIGYDPAAKKLRVQFKGGGLYEYYDVPAAAHEKFMAAESKGGHFAKHIRGEYDTKKL